jgi:hypothetical protein
MVKSSNQSLEPTAGGVKSTFDFMKQFLMFATLASASGSSAWLVRSMGRGHDLAFAACMICAVFGGGILLAFAMAFSQLNVLGRSIQIAKERKKGFVWWYAASGLVADWQIWRETKGVRWLLPLGAMFCLAAYLIHRVYLA